MHLEYWDITGKWDGNDRQKRYPTFDPAPGKFIPSTEVIMCTAQFEPPHQDPQQPLFIFYQDDYNENRQHQQFHLTPTSEGIYKVSTDIGDKKHA